MIANMKYKTMFGNCLGEVLKHGSPAACVMFVVGSSPQASAVSVPFNPIQALRTFTQYSLHQKKSWFSLLGGSVLVKKQPAEGEHNAQADNIKYSIHVSFIFESFSWDCSDCKKHTYWMSPKFTNSKEIEHRKQNMQKKTKTQANNNNNKKTYKKKKKHTRKRSTFLQNNTRTTNIHTTDTQHAHTHQKTHTHQTKHTPIYN